MEPVADQRIYSHRYQVTHLIARGGMALVYRAQDLLLNRPVALKILYPELSADPNFVERFRREAQAAANLSHPNIVPVFDWGEDEGTYFIVMELIEGTSLAETLRERHTLTAARAAQLAAQVAAALGYANRSGVVHRDVKPGNILITPEGQVKVTDFGIAQAVAAHDHLADEGSVMGTATYFSPEQAEGAAVDGRSDVYSLGVVLYEMLAGRPPFVGESPVAVSSQHVHQPVPPLSEFVDVPHDLEAIVMEALAKSPARRYQSADEFRADLLRFSEGAPVRAAERDRAFFGDDATRSVTTVVGGERTQAVPLMTGPRTDIRRRRRTPTGAIIAGVAVILLLAGGLTYALLAKGTTTTTMPDLVGKDISVARATLLTEGLKVASVQLVPSSKPKNQVLSTTPRAGVKVLKGEAVTLNVSLGHAVTPVTIPNVTNFPLATAQSVLGAKGLSYKTQFTSTFSGAPQPNVVLNQVPQAGTTGHSGDTVTLIVLDPSAKFPVPSTSGQTVSLATQTLVQWTLTVASKNQNQCSNTVPNGQVIGTNPAAGTLVGNGTSITLIVSSGFCPVTVLNVVGDSSGQAQSTLQGQGFQIGTVSTVADPSCVDAPSGSVFSQTPVGGTSVPYGSTVDLEVCP
jgi:beta-lactam-binding protein with PASTA domain/predicted Ser/Thr protein kinase